jgi:hypothetical protein
MASCGVRVLDERIFQRIGRRKRMNGAPIGDNPQRKCPDRPGVAETARELNI